MPDYSKIKTLDDLVLVAEDLDALVKAQTFKIQELESMEMRVRELHKQVGNVCHTCSTFDTAYLTLYPCPTIKALDGELNG